MSKLVRDKLPEIDPSMRAAPAFKGTHLWWLLRKLREETEEVCSSATYGPGVEVLEELADVYEVLCEIAELWQYDPGDIENMAEAKRRDKGGFSKMLIWNEGRDEA